MISLYIILIITATIPFTISLTYMKLTKRFLKIGQRTTGIIFIQAKYWNQGLLYSYPAVRFSTKDFNVVEGRSEFSNNPLLYAVGQEVAVLYNPSNPTNFHIYSEKILKLCMYCIWAIVTLLFLVVTYYVS